MTEFAKAVAKQLDRRHRRRRLIILGGWIALVVLAAVYLRCGRGWGLGGTGGGGSGTASGTTPVLPQRCAIRVTAAGITVDGKPATRGQAVAVCRATAGADVVVTGDARQGDWDELHAALDAAHIAIFRHEAAP